MIPMDDSFADWLDSDFSGNWDPSTAENDPMTEKLGLGVLPFMWRVPSCTSQNCRQILRLVIPRAII
jgi:hypothetical protein